MKKVAWVITLLIISVFILVSCAPPATEAPEFEASESLPDLDGTTITVAVEDAYPPFNYVDEDSGESIGWDYDVVSEICNRINCVPEFKVSS